MRSYAIGAWQLPDFTDIADGTPWTLDDFRNPFLVSPCENPQP
ncbi:hypothetical protein [Herbidospora sp. RD11066]